MRLSGARAPWCALLLLLWLWPHSQAFAGPPQYRITSVAGTNQVGDGGHATAAQLAAVEGLAVDTAGNIYISDNLDNRIRKVNSAGTVSTVAGNGHTGFHGDGGPAAQALLTRPYGLAVDGSGNLFVADYGNGRVRVVASDGNIRTVAGGGDRGAAGGDALAARLLGPRNVALDSAGNLYISDFVDHRVYRVTPTGQIATFAGTGVAGYNGDAQAAYSRLNAPAGLAVDRQGVLYIADSENNRIRRLSGGFLTTVLGGEGSPVELKRPTGVAVDFAGTLYVADSENRRVLKRTAEGLVTVLTGGTPGIGAREVALDGGGNVYSTDGRRVQKISPRGAITLFAGDGTFGLPLNSVAATNSYLNGPIGVAVNGAGTLYIAEEGNRRVRAVNAQGTIVAVAGSGAATSGGDGGPATSAGLLDPVAVAADAESGFWIADYQGNRVRRVNLAGFISNVAGTGQPGYLGDDGPAIYAHLNRPRGLALDRAGNLYIADSLNHRVRRIRVDGAIVSVAGTGVRGYGGDGGPATLAHLDTPVAVAADASGNLYIADSGNHVIRRVDATGLIATFAGSGIRGSGGDGGPAARAQLNFPAGVAIDSAGTLLIADSGNHRIRAVGADGIIHTIAGTGAPGFTGDDGPAREARLRSPSGVAVDAAGAVYVADLDNNRVRKLTPVIEPAPVLSEIRVVHAASLLGGPVAPGQVITIFGANLGPSNPAHARLNPGGALDRTLGETEVRFDGALAALFFSQESQVNLQVPYQVAGVQESAVEVYYQGRLRSRARVAVTASAPGLFTVSGGAGQAIAVQEDGSLNSPANPADRGAVVTLYATGEGQTDPPGTDGRPAQSPLGRPLLPVYVRIGGLPAEVLWAGSAPGMVGVMQINVRVPSGFVPSGLLALTASVGGVSSQPGVILAVR